MVDREGQDNGERAATSADGGDSWPLVCAALAIPEGRLERHLIAARQMSDVTNGPMASMVHGSGTCAPAQRPKIGEDCVLSGPRDIVRGKVPGDPGIWQVKAGGLALRYPSSWRWLHGGRRRWGG